MKSLYLVLSLLVTIVGFSQKISVSPTRLYYTSSPGQTGTKTLTVTNNAQVKQAFELTFGDFSATREGKTNFLDAGVNPRSCAKWMTATPSFFELEPGQTQQIKVVISVPQDSTGRVASWAMAYVRLAKEKVGDGENGGPKQLAVALNESYRFGVYIFETPPSAKISSGEIIGFESPEAREVKMVVKNVGETFLKCNTYLELVKLSTGEEFRLNAKSFTVLPTGEREVLFGVPESIKTGDYSVLGVLDYGDAAELKAAELQLTIE